MLVFGLAFVMEVIDSTGKPRGKTEVIPLSCASEPNLGEKGSSKKFANSNGLVVQLGKAEEFHASGKGGCVLRKPIMLLSERSLCKETTRDEREEYLHEATCTIDLDDDVAGGDGAKRGGAGRDQDLLRQPLRGHQRARQAQRQRHQERDPRARRSGLRRRQAKRRRALWRPGPGRGACR